MREPVRLSKNFGITLFGSLMAVLTLIVYLDGLSAAKQAQASTVSTLTPSALAPLCRFGVNVTGNVTDYDITSMRIGWYIDYRASASPPAVAADYGPVIRLTQTSTNTYTYRPNGSQLQAVIAANPGVMWMISNEPDSPYQDNVEPHIYAMAYHELYGVIKAADSTARVIAGNIVQATPLRIQYLDMILDSYRSLYGEYLPADGWGIHNFILNEATCDPDSPYSANCWGAEIPPGINAEFGELLTIDDNDNMLLFKERIERFRDWMATNGYHDLPLYVTEYGINMPDWLGFDTARVNTFMDAAFDYMMTAVDPDVGDPADSARLVQKWSWYSTSDNLYNGWLFDPISFVPTAMGSNYAAYTAVIADDVDLFPVRIFADPLVSFSQGENVTMTLKAQVANGGNLWSAAGPFVVRFYDGDPASGGVQIGAGQQISLSGCGDRSSVEVQWSDVSPGAHYVYVAVDQANAVAESNEGNNVRSQMILVAAERLLLPVIKR